MKAVPAAKIYREGQSRGDLYMTKLVHDILVDHASKIKYAYLCDEVAAWDQNLLTTL